MVMVGNGAKVELCDVSGNDVSYYPIVFGRLIDLIFGDGWGLVRASNTQPVLVARFESKTQDGLEKIEKEVMEKLKEFGIS